MNKFIQFSLMAIGVVAIYRWAKEEGYIGETKQPEKGMQDVAEEQPAQPETISQAEADALAKKAYELSQKIPTNGSPISQKHILKMKENFQSLLDRLAANGYQYKVMQSVGDDRVIAKAIKISGQGFENG